MNIKREKNDTVISVRTSKRASKRLATLAQTTRRSKSFLANEAIERYLAEEEAFVAAVKEGIADAEAGRVISSEQMKKELEKIISRAAKK